MDGYLNKYLFITSAKEVCVFRVLLVFMVVIRDTGGFRALNISYFILYQNY